MDVYALSVHLLKSDVEVREGRLQRALYPTAHLDHEPLGVGTVYANSEASPLLIQEFEITLWKEVGVDVDYWRLGHGSLILRFLF
jgi:hypothetical protein